MYQSLGLQPCLQRRKSPTKQINCCSYSLGLIILVSLIWSITFLCLVRSLSQSRGWVIFYSQGFPCIVCFWLVKMIDWVFSLFNRLQVAMMVILEGQERPMHPVQSRLFPESVLQGAMGTLSGSGILVSFLSD